MRESGIEGSPPEHIKLPTPSFWNYFPTKMPWNSSSGANRRALKQSIARREQQATKDLRGDDQYGA